MAGDELLVDEAIDLAGEWVRQAENTQSRAERAVVAPLRRLIQDSASVGFAMRFVDRVVRPDDDLAAALQLNSLVDQIELPGFLSRVDRLLLRTGAALAPRLPTTVVPLARRRMRQLVGQLVVDANPEALAAHLGKRHAQGFSQNVNLLGEAVLGNAEAARRLEATLALTANPKVNYMSVKLSSVVSQLNHWDWDNNVVRVSAKFAEILRAAANSTPPTFVSLDMEEYLDLELTIAAFIETLDRGEFRSQSAGIVLQAYLPDSFAALQRLVSWAGDREKAGGADIKIRLVKGANLAMEKVEAAVHGWSQAPYSTKHETDANYKRCLGWVLTPERTKGVRIGVGSHNLFDVAWAYKLAEQRKVLNRVQFEMLQGMAPAHARVVGADHAEGSVLLYTPIVAMEHFDVAISYLFRRLEENTAPRNFIANLHSMQVSDRAFLQQSTSFRKAVVDRDSVDFRPRRSQERPTLSFAPAEEVVDVDPAPDEGAGESEVDGEYRSETETQSASSAFVNEPDTDPSLASNRVWVSEVVSGQPKELTTGFTSEPDEIKTILELAAKAQPLWAAVSAADRRLVLRRVANFLSARRGELITAMMHEANKTFGEADIEVSEAVDFARYYADRATELSGFEASAFEPLGTVAVISPWNFPVAIPAGGVLAALAAGNAAVLKPAPETPLCGQLIVECLWAAGVSSELVQVVRMEDGELGKHLVEGVDGVVLTGSSMTAQLFQSWNPRLKLLAETSGKNALVVTSNADVDLSVADLVASAFGHGGQKCSAASLVICVGDVYHSSRFRRQLADAVESLVLGPATDLGTDVAPLVGAPSEHLRRALTELDDGEDWLVEPRKLDGDGELWSPGVRLGVAPGGWFHTTECFGPVLGVVAVADLDEAIAVQNDTGFGLTGGIHSLDPDEVDYWLDRVEVGNAYVNRAITGAIVQRQPFGGWKKSVVGPGAKAGGPNYVSRLGRWRQVVVPASEDFLEVAASSDRRALQQEFSVEHDPSGLYCEANIFRYRKFERMAFRIGLGAKPAAVERVRQGAKLVGVGLVESSSEFESDEEFALRLPKLAVGRVRLLGGASDIVWAAAAESGLHIVDDPVSAEGRLELQHFFREQSVSRTLHRFGNVVDDAAV